MLVLRIFVFLKSIRLSSVKTIFYFLCIILTVVIVFQFVINIKYSYPQPGAFTGKNLYNPYTDIDTAKWKRANFHLHTRLLFGLTDGAGNSVQIADSFYKFFGYDVSSISDYMRINNYKSNNGIFIASYEHGYQYYKTHQLVINTNKILWTDYFFRQTLNNKQYIINRLKRDSSTLVAIVHPKTRDGYLLSDFKHLGNYDYLEIADSKHAFSMYYDTILSSGHPVFIIANDDSHDLSGFTDGAHSFNVINADPDSRSIICALRTGKSYGVVLNLKPYKTNYEKRVAMERLPVLTGFEIHHDTLIVKMNQKADSIKFIGQNGILKTVFLNSRIGRYLFSLDDTYIRTEIVCNDGSVYFLNPVFRNNGSYLPVNLPEVNVIATYAYRISFAIISLLVFFLIITHRSIITGKN